MIETCYSVFVNLLTSGARISIFYKNISPHTGLRDHGGHEGRAAPIPKSLSGLRPYPARITTPALAGFNDSKQSAKHFAEIITFRQSRRGAMI